MTNRDCTSGLPRRGAWRAGFIEALRAGHKVDHAAKAAGVTRRHVYRTRQLNPDFQRQWAAAIALRPPPPPLPPLVRPRHWRRDFCAALAETSSVKRAAERVGMTKSGVYAARRADPEFRAQWNAALLEGYEHLELETLERLRMGTRRGGPHYDLGNALRMLRLRGETAARERALREEEDEDAILDALDARIDEMRAREAAAALLLAEGDGDDTAASA